MDDTRLLEHGEGAGAFLPNLDGCGMFPLPMRAHLITTAFVVLLSILANGETASKRAVETRRFPAAEAIQAAAADDRFFYAVDSTAVAKYDRTTGERMGVSTGKAKHLNSAFVWKGKVYCAHSNYPRKPERSEIMLLDSETMALSSFKDFGEYRGSLTWAIREKDHWWCTFAHYGKDNARTVLVKLDDDWKEHGAWYFPPDVIKHLGNYSISGGIWRDDHLLVTGHDHRVLYRLRLPASGEILELVETIRAPFTGQGIANDPATGGLVGIDRGKKQVVFAELKE